MFCAKCGKEVENGARFCPGCGAALTVENPPAPPAPPVPPVSKETKKAPKWLLPGIAAAVVVVLLIALLGGSPSDKLGKALDKSGEAFADVFEEIGMFNLTEAMTMNDFSEQFSLWIDRMAGSSEMEGFGMRFDVDVSMSDRKVGVEMVPYLGAADLLKVQMKADNDKLYFGSPELLEDSFFMIDTTTLGNTMDNLLGAEELKDLSFNMFDLAKELQDISSGNEEAAKAVEKALKEFSKSIEVTQEGKESVEVNDATVKCTAYHVVISRTSLKDLLSALIVAYKMSDSTDAYAALMESAGLPEEIVDEFKYSMQYSTSDMDYFFDELREIVNNLDDVELDVYVNKGYVVAAAYETTIDGTDVECTLNIGGGKTYVDNISLRMTVDDEELYITSSGNHACSKGTFSDETNIVLEAYGERETIATIETEYTPKAQADNFSWKLESYDSEIRAEGQVELNKNDLNICLDEISFDDQVVIGMELLLGKYEADQISVENHMDLATMTEEDLQDVGMDIAENAQILIEELSERIPGLEYLLYYSLY